ncbi:MAG TPA: phosphoribosylaminoimidazolesuccinocarboxamide synthase [Clostridia bacterium]|nr:phosphoribosylaminoimidazolesuccinocarboxamide synthase [Clostridia bacterium]
MNIKPFKKGKVRDLYDLDDKMLMVASDRISAFDCVFDEPIPTKGIILNSISAFFFEYTKDIIENHLISADISDFPAPFNEDEYFKGRSMLVKKIKMLPVECVVRGYLEGSGLKEYNKTGSVCNIPLKEGLKQADKLDEPIYTPSIKAEEGHDVNTSYEETVKMIGADLALKLKKKSLELYKKVSDYALTKGIIIADTKFEFGVLDGRLVLADEIFTPDSSRFWDVDDYMPGKAQKSFDKQYLREYLETTGWDKNPPAPKLTDEVITQTLNKYMQAYERLVK